MPAMVGQPSQLSEQAFTHFILPWEGRRRGTSLRGGAAGSSKSFCKLALPGRLPVRPSQGRVNQNCMTSLRESLFRCSSSILDRSVPKNALCLQGIIPPLVTPLRDRDQLDLPGLQRLLEHVIGGGVHGLFILGTTGEAPSLSYALRRELIEQVCSIVQRAIPVLVGVTDTAFTESVALARVAADAGADAVVLSTPYYFPAGQTELIGYIEHITAELPLPLVLYNMPSLTKVWFEIETLEKLAALPQIIGVKDSSGDLDYFARLAKLKSMRPDWSVMIGTEVLLGDAMAMAGDGAVAGGANLFPRLFVDTYQALAAGDDAAARPLQQQIVELQRIYDVGKYVSRFIKATKCGLSLMGICDDFMAEPFHRFRAPQRQQVAEILQRIEPSVDGVRR
jgi:2-dehydro-3-deoxy-D-pentonate aldolase